MGIFLYTFMICLTVYLLLISIVAYFSQCKNLSYYLGLSAICGIIAKIFKYFVLQYPVPYVGFAKFLLICHLNFYLLPVSLLLYFGTKELLKQNLEGLAIGSIISSNVFLYFAYPTIRGAALLVALHSAYLAILIFLFILFLEYMTRTKFNLSQKLFLMVILGGMFEIIFNLIFLDWTFVLLSNFLFYSAILIWLLVTKLRKSLVQ